MTNSDTDKSKNHINNNNETNSNRNSTNCISNSIDNSTLSSTNSTTLTQHHHHHHHRHKDHAWDLSKARCKSPHRKCSRHISDRRKSESVLSTDSDIRFTRRKLGDSQRCGCAVIAGFLVALLLAGIAVYIGYTYFRPEQLPERVFRTKLRVIQGDAYTGDLADQQSLIFQHKARDYRERINLVIRRSDLRESYDGCEVLALDGTEGENDLIIHSNLNFNPYRGVVSVADLMSIFLDEMAAGTSRHFSNLTFDPNALIIIEVTGNLVETQLLPITSTASSLDSRFDIDVSTVPPIPRRCEPLALPYCRSMGYNITTYPNFLGHYSIDEVFADLIPFRELVDAECFRQAYDFVCRLLQPKCIAKPPYEPDIDPICREYCQLFLSGCGNRLPERFRKYFDCERFPESIGSMSCRSKPGCHIEMHATSSLMKNRLCDGVADCPDLVDEKTCSYCPPNALYCGRGRACIPRAARCDGKLDCPDGTDEKDCLSIAPLVSTQSVIEPYTPHRSRFHSEGFAVFSEKGGTGKLCAEGLDSPSEVGIRKTVAESLCKALGYQKILYSHILNDSEPNISYVRVLDPHAPEISFVRTMCRQRQALYVACDRLECGIQSVVPSNHITSLQKMASPGDWPWHVTLFRDERHVCDGTLVSDEWVLTTESCFQGQSKATWIAVSGIVRLNSNPPWAQRRRIVGMVKSPVEGSTAALIRLESPVVFSDFVRPICLPDDLSKSIPIKSPIIQTDRVPLTEKLDGHLIRNRPHEIRQYFISPYIRSSDDSESISKGYEAKFVDGSHRIPRAQPQFSNDTTTTIVSSYGNRLSIKNSSALPIRKSTVSDHLWINCNTLGWSKLRDQLQRVQLKIGDMAACENVSIATVNSMCTEAAFHKQDCTEEEYAGSPVFCMLPGNDKRWAMVGVASWRIACAQNGLERPRMYDKITSNSAWVRDTINAS